MIIDDLLQKQGMTKYRLAMTAQIPHATLNDLCNGKTRLEKCSSDTVYKIAKALNVPMELLMESAIRQTAREKAYEYGLPDYLQHDLDAYKEGRAKGSSLLDCLWGDVLTTIDLQRFVDPVLVRRRFLTTYFEARRNDGRGRASERLGHDARRSGARRAFEKGPVEVADWVMSRNLIFQNTPLRAARGF